MRREQKSCLGYVPHVLVSCCTGACWRASVFPSMIRQSGNILDIASATCSRSNRALGFVSQHRIPSLVKGLCRAANFCKAGQIAVALRVACNGLSTAGKKSRMPRGMRSRLDCLHHYNQCPTLFRSLLAIWLGTGDCISPTAILNAFLFKIGVRSEIDFASSCPVFHMPTTLLSTCEERTRVKVSFSRNLWMAELR